MVCMKKAIYGRRHQRKAVEAVAYVLQMARSWSQLRASPADRPQSEKNLVQPDNGRTTPWSTPIWEGCNSISDIACHVQNCLGRYIIRHTCNVAEQGKTVLANHRLDTL